MMYQALAEQDINKGLATEAMAAALVFNFLNNKYYPGLYDTLLFAVSKLITNIFGINIIVQSSHIVNWLFSIIS